MSDFIIGHVTDPKEGPLDGVYAETKRYIYEVQRNRSISEREENPASESSGCRNQGKFADRHGKYQ